MSTPEYSRWKARIGIDAEQTEQTARRLRGLGYLCRGWALYRCHVGDPGPEGDVMDVLSWALDELAARLEPPAPFEPPRVPDTPDELLRG